MKQITKLLAAVAIAASATPIHAQSAMDESFHANGSIRVVLAVAALVVGGLLAYVFYLDKRLKKLEKKN
ncbi:MAG: CcmD family protein [Flavobacteriales bacterium]